MGNPSFLYAVARGANYSHKTPDLHKGSFQATLGQVAFSASKVQCNIVLHTKPVINIFFCR